MMIGKILKKVALKMKKKNAKIICRNNPFLRCYSDFEKISIRNKDEALNYMKGLKAGAFFSGWVLD